MQRVALGRPSWARTRIEDGEGEPAQPDGAVTAVAKSARTGQTFGPIAATDPDGDGQWTALLPAAAVALLDELTVTWAAEVAGVAWTWQTTVQVTAAHLFTIAEARAYSTLKNTPGPRIEELRLDAQSALEGRCGFAFIPRLTSVPVNRRRSDGAVTGVARTEDVSVLPLRELRVLVGVTLDGETVSPAAHTVKVSRAGVVTGLASLADGDVRLLVEHGADSPPGGAASACLLLAADMAEDRDRRLIRRGSDQDYEVFYSNDAAKGAFPIPDVEAFCQRVERLRLV